MVSQRQYPEIRGKRGRSSILAWKEDFPKFSASLLEGCEYHRHSWTVNWSKRRQPSATEEEFGAVYDSVIRRFHGVKVTVEWPTRVDFEGFFLAFLDLFRNCFIQSNVTFHFKGVWSNVPEECSARRALPWKEGGLQPELPASETILKHLLNFRCRSLRTDQYEAFSEDLMHQAIQAAQSKSSATSLFSDFSAYVRKCQQVFGDSSSSRPTKNLSELYKEMLRGNKEVYETIKAGDAKLMARYAEWKPTRNSKIQSSVHQAGQKMAKNDKEWENQENKRNSVKCQLEKYHKRAGAKPS